MVSDLEIGKLYLWDSFGFHQADKAKPRVVFVLSSQKVKPIYTQFNLLVLSSNECHKAIIDKFNIKEFLKDFTEVTDEAQLEQARKQATK
jgi:hypothetical protein